jgi:hypothetical protein
MTKDFGAVGMVALANIAAVQSRTSACHNLSFFQPLRGARIWGETERPLADG